MRPLSESRREDFEWGLDSFLSEARTLARFRHDNIVGVHTVFEENRTAYMVMPYEEGDSLFELYRRREYRDQASLERVFFPIFDGLAEIHALGFVHRDIKPANIYIRSNGTPVLLDFGAARRILQQRTSEMTSLVSQGYTPFEQYSADYGEQGPWTDIYALAATMREGVVGERPADALRRSGELTRQRPDPVPALSSASWPGFDQRFLDALHAALAPEPEARPVDLDHWLALFREGEPSPAARDARVEAEAATRIRQDGTTSWFDEEAPSEREESPETGMPEWYGRIPASPAAPPTREDRAAVPPPDEDRTRIRPPPAVAAAPRSVELFDPDDMTRVADISPGASGLHGRRKSGTIREPVDVERPRRGGWLGGALAAVALVGVLTGGLWWYLGGPSLTPARDVAVIVAPDPALVDALPMPPAPIALATRESEIGDRLGTLEELASLYRRVEAAGASGVSVESDARAIREELGTLAAQWNPVRHAALIGQLERVVTLLPERVAERAALDATIASAAARSDLDAIRALLERGAVVEPAGEALIDRISVLGEEDYRALVATPAWRSMMGTLGRDALARVRAADFDGASLLVRAALTLQPDEPFMRRLGDHLGGGRI